MVAGLVVGKYGVLRTRVRPMRNLLAEKSAVGVADGQATEAAEGEFRDASGNMGRIAPVFLAGVAQ